jgi:hypothetical protein
MIFWNFKFICYTFRGVKYDGIIHLILIFDVSNKKKIKDRSRDGPGAFGYPAAFCGESAICSRWQCGGESAVKLKSVPENLLLSAERDV